ncbi:hypothetical protein pb186bvf_014023 [Paramecium bursaria]
MYQDKCDNFDRPDIFVVQGQASYQATPSCATINFGIIVKEESASAALKKAAELSDKAVNAMKQISENLKLQTSSFSLQPFQDGFFNQTTNKYETTFKGYQVSNQIIAETKEIPLVGKIVDVGVKAGANSVDGIQFDISPQEKAVYNDKLIEAAIEDATQKATIILKQLKLKVASIKSVQIDDMEMQYQVNPSKQLTQSVHVGFVIESL